MDHDELKIKKISTQINSNVGVIFDTKNENEVYLPSDAQIIKYNYETGFISDRYKVYDRKIMKFLVIEEDTNSSLICVTKDNHLIEFDISKKQITKKIKISEKEEYEIINFKFSQFLNIFILQTKSGEIILIKNNYDNFEIEKTIQIETNFNFSFLEINNEGKVCIIANKNKLILLNLLNFERKEIEFQVNLSAGLFLGEDRVVIGDMKGKLHFISNLKDAKQMISSKHWHSHKVSALETDKNNDYLYTAGQEGVIVVWNLKTEEKSFLPRLMTEINSIRISTNNQILSITCRDNSVKFINLFNFTVINEVTGVCLEKIHNEEINSKNISNCVRQISFKGENYLILFNQNSGKLQILNLNNGKILSNSSLLFKNFTSQTEKEKINFRKLIYVEINKPDLNYLITYEEIQDDLDKKFLISYLKLWRVNNFKENFSIDLMSIAENPHDNEKISHIQFKNNKLVTQSEKCFKVWEVQSNEMSDNDKPNFQCLFKGSYRNENISYVNMFNDETIFSFHDNNCLVQWKNREIVNTFNFTDLIKSSKWNILTDDSKLILYSDNQFVIFSLLNWEVEMIENFDKFSIINSSVEIDSEGKVWLILQNKEKKNEFIIYGIYKNKVEDCLMMKKNNIKYINHWKNCNSLLMINVNGEILISKKKSLLGNKQTKREEDEGKEVEEEITDIIYNKK